MRLKHSIVVVALSASLPAWAINKCVGADGKVSYQAQPCVGAATKTINIKTPAAASPKPESVPSAAAPAAQSSEQRTLANFARDRRIREIKDKITGLENDVEQRNRRMQAEMDALQYKKSFANNNLAGATYQQSLSVEMQAVATRYQAQNDVDFERIKALRTELAGIEAAKP